MKNKIGLVAGGGKFPVMFAKEAALSGCDVYVAGLKGVASAELEKIAAKVEYFRLGQISGPIEFFSANGVSKVAMAGLIRHNSVFGGIMPDMRAAKIMAGLADMRAETILGAVAKEFASEGIEIISSATFLGEAMVRTGIFVGKKPGSDRQKSIEIGWKAAKTLAGLDIGLTVVLMDKAVLALEGMEGTDACILRAGEIAAAAPGRKSGGLVVVKVARPRQDFRFDLPVIGKGTIESMQKAGAEVLAVEADKTIIVDKSEVLKMADSAGITVLGLNDGQYQI